MVKDWKLFLLRPGARKGCSSFAISWRSKMISVHRWHDHVCRKSKRLYIKLARTNKWIQQSCRIQNHCTKISCISIQKQWQSKEEIKKTILFIIASEKIKYLGISNRRGKSLVPWKLKHCLKEIKEYTKKWEDIICSQIEKILCCKMPILFNVCMLGCVPIFAIPWTVAYQSPLSMEFSAQEI